MNKFLFHEYSRLVWISVPLFSFRLSLVPPIQCILPLLRSLSRSFLPLSLPFLSIRRSSFYLFYKHTPDRRACVIQLKAVKALYSLICTESALKDRIIVRYNLTKSLLCRLSHKCSPSEALFKERLTAMPSRGVSTRAFQCQRMRCMIRRWV